MFENFQFVKTHSTIKCICSDVVFRVIQKIQTFQNVEITIKTKKSYSLGQNKFRCAKIFQKSLYLDIAISLQNFLKNHLAKPPIFSSQMKWKN